MLITFEGIDASGKTTQLELLAQVLENKGYRVVSTRQPGGTPIGKLIRSILLNPDNTDMIPETEVLLYMADRLQHIKQVIIPALNAGNVVLCDRYHDATLAYQGFGRQLDLSWLKPIEDRFIRVPDLTLWFDLSVATSQARLQQRNKTQNMENCRLERENIGFFDRIRTAYRTFAGQDRARFVTVDAEADIQSIQAEVATIVLNKLSGTL